MSIMKGIMSITDKDVLKVISEESANFEKRAAARIYGKRIANLAAKVLKTVDSSLEGEGVRDLLANNFVSTIMPNLSKNSEVLKSLESGEIGNTYATHLGAIVHKYVAQESYYRSNELKKQLLSKMGVTELDRKSTIDRIVGAFESEDLQLPLSESMNEEVEDLSGDEENAIVASAADDVKEDITDAEDKADATRTIINEFKDVSAKAKEEQVAITPDPEAAIEALKFDPTQFIKDIIPVTAVRFALESEKGTFTKHKLVGMLLTLEDHDDLKEGTEFIAKRIQAIRDDVITTVPAKIDQVDSLEKIFEAAKTDVNGVFSTFRQLGFGRGDLPAGKRDADTLDLISKMADLRSKDDATRINDVELLIEGKVEPILTAEEFLKTSFEAFEIRSAIATDVKDYDKYIEAIELRDNQIGEFLVKGLEHVPAARAERLKEIASGLKKLAYNDGLRQFDPERLKSIYYKTAQLSKPELFVNWEEEATRVKEFVATTYSTDAYSEIVDDFFNGKGTSSHLSEENFYEVFAFKSAMEVTAESGTIDAAAKKSIKNYSTVYASYFQTLENLHILSKEDLKKYVRNFKK